MHSRVLEWEGLQTAYHRPAGETFDFRYEKL